MAFWQLTVASSPESTDGLTNFLWEQGALGVVEEETPPDPARLRAFFPETASSTALMTAVRAYCASLRSLGLSGAAAEPAISPLLDAAWASAWQQSFPARAIGERLLVRPPWEADLAANGRLVLVIEPGRAFGTGHHGSTEGCLVLLERALADRAGARVLDIGTGSGILAVAAVKLGAVSALGIDVDPDATSAAQTNAERNGCADRIEIALAGPETLTGEAFPVAVANLLTHTHLAMAPIYARLVAPGGALVLGGILAEEDPQVTAAVEPVGFIQRDRLVLEGWSSLRLDRPPHRALTAFLVHAESAADERVSFDAGEAHHLARVLRLGPGDLVQAVDGHGHELTVRVTEVGAHGALGLVVSRTARPTESPLDLTLVQGIVKGDKLEGIIRMATELGVCRVAPVVTERTIARAAPARWPHRLERWRRVAKEAAKQSGRAVIPEIDPPRPLGEWLASPRPPGLVVCFWEGESNGLDAVLPVGRRRAGERDRGTGGRLQRG